MEKEQNANSAWHVGRIRARLFCVSRLLVHPRATTIPPNNSFYKTITTQTNHYTITQTYNYITLLTIKLNYSIIRTPHEKACIIYTLARSSHRYAHVRVLLPRLCGLCRAELIKMAPRQRFFFPTSLYYFSPLRATRFSGSECLREERRKKGVRERDEGPIGRQWTSSLVIFCRTRSGDSCLFFQARAVRLNSLILRFCAGRKYCFWTA